MTTTPTRFPKQSAWRAVDAILERAWQLQPSHPDNYPDGTLSSKQYRYLEARYYDFERIAAAAQCLRDAIGALR